MLRFLSLLCVWITLCGVSHCETLIPPKILSSSPQSFHQPLDSTVKIYCRAEGSPKPKITWTKDDKPIRQTSRVKLINSGSKVYIAEVLISNLQESDGGIYKCTFQNTVGLISQTVHLIVEGQAYIIVPPSNKTAVLGQRIQFTCEARGYPSNITYNWLKEDRYVNRLPGYGSRIMINRDGSLVITIVEKEDMGWYLCRPSNGVGQDDPEAVAYLNITYEPEVLIDQMPRSAIWAMGFKEKLDCPVRANPPAYSIVWTKNGIVVDTEPSRLVILGNGTLVVSQVAMGDAGNYRCTALSSFGTGESQIVQVEVKDPPRFSLRPEPEYILSLGDTVRMSCAATGTPRPTIIWRKKETGTLNFDGRIQHNSGNLTIFDLQKSDHGVYECEASNEVRKIVISTMLTVQNTTPHAPYNVSVATKWFSAAVSWIPAYSSTPQNYLIWYRSVINNMPSQWQTMRVEPQNTTRFTIYRLESDTLYEFKVSARNLLGGGDESSSSTIVQARTLGYVNGIPDVPPTDETGSTYFPTITGPKGPRPSTPINLSVKLNGEKIEISWDAPTDSPVTIYHYLVEYNVGNGWIKTDLVKAPLTSLLFDSVENGQTHSFRVKSRGIYAFSLPSEIVSLQAPEEEGFGLSSTEIGGIIGGLLFLIVAVLLAVIAVMCSRRKDKRKNTKYGNVKYLGPQDEADSSPMNNKKAKIRQNGVMSHRVEEEETL
ncbi:putative aminophospholipid-translocase [Mactra antiquata]